jgi:hypothetical protein
MHILDGIEVSIWPCWKMADRVQFQHPGRSPTYLYELSTAWSQSGSVDIDLNNEDLLQGLRNNNLPGREGRQGERISVRHSFDLKGLIAKLVLESREGS